MIESLIAYVVCWWPVVAPMPVCQSFEVLAECRVVEWEHRREPDVLIDGCSAIVKSNSFTLEMPLESRPTVLDKSMHPIPIWRESCTSCHQKSKHVVQR